MPLRVWHVDVEITGEMVVLADTEHEARRRAERHVDEEPWFDDSFHYTVSEVTADEQDRLTDDLLDQVPWSAHNVNSEQRTVRQILEPTPEERERMEEQADWEARDKVNRRLPGILDPVPPGRPEQGGRKAGPKAAQ